MRSSLLLTAGLLGLASSLWLHSAEAAPAPAPAVAASPAASGTFDIDLVHSAILFRIKHLDVAWNYGRFADFSGSVVLDEDPAKCSVQVEIDAASVDTFHKGRDEHVTGPDFFSVKEFPKITFASTRVAKDGDTYTVQGDLTFHGKTKPVTLVMEKTGEAETRQGYKAGFHGEMTLKRRDFGIDTFPDEALSNEVHLTLAIEAKRKE